MSWEPRYVLAGSSTSSPHKTAVKVLSRALGLILGRDWGRSHFQAPLVAGRIQVLAGCWTEGFSVLLAVSSFSLEPSPAGSLQQSQQGRVTAGMTNITVSCNIIAKVTYHHLCHILLVWSKCGSCPHSRGKDCPGVQVPGGRDSGVHLLHVCTVFPWFIPGSGMAVL